MGAQDALGAVLAPPEAQGALSGDVLRLPNRLRVPQLAQDPPRFQRVDLGAHDVAAGTRELDAGAQQPGLRLLARRARPLGQGQGLPAGDQRALGVLLVEVRFSQAPQRDRFQAAVADPAGEERGLLGLLARLVEGPRPPPPLGHVHQEPGEPARVPHVPHDPLRLLERDAGTVDVPQGQVRPAEQVQRGGDQVPARRPPRVLERFLGPLVREVVPRLLKMERGQALERLGDPVAIPEPAVRLERGLEARAGPLGIPQAQRREPRARGGGRRALHVAARRRALPRPLVRLERLARPSLDLV